MCLSVVYKDEVNEANLLARNIADVRIDEDRIVLTDLMGVRTVIDGSLERVDLMDNYIVIKGQRRD